MKINNSIFDTLKAVAVTNDNRAKMAAALVSGNRIISIGFNRNKSDPLQAKYSKNPDSIYLHAEIHAIKNALREIPLNELRKMDMYICRVKRPSTYATNFVYGMACPCAGCRRAIAEFEIRNVAFTCDDGSIGVF